MNLDLFTISPRWCSSPECRAPAAASRASSGEAEQGRQDGTQERAFGSTQHDSTALQSKPSKDVHHERENVFVD
jgi:hypothetical protein